jgi:hypothetical protein
LHDTEHQESILEQFRNDSGIGAFYGEWFVVKAHRRSLHCAPSDFLLRLVVSAKFLRLS